jgi:hypothetical protein
MHPRQLAASIARATLGAALTLTLLAGCSGMRLVESQVRTATPAESAPIPQDAHYRFERLPSQTDPIENDSVDAIAEAELMTAGLVHDEQKPQYSVQITTRMESYQVDDFGRPYTGSTRIMIGGGFGGYSGFGWGLGGMNGMGMRYPPSLQYRHEVALLLRDLSTQKVVYETRAIHEGPWSDRYNILRATLAAALKDFPQAPTGMRRVQVEVPR